VKESERQTQQPRREAEACSKPGCEPRTRLRNGDNEAWFTPWRFATLLGLLILLCFPQVVVGLETFYYVDYGQFGYPLAFYQRESFWRGEVPLWNPLNNCGLPFLAQWNTLTLYPLSLVYVLFPLPWSLAMFCLGHLYLAGLGMYSLAYRWTGHRLAAAVAGAAFAFNGLTWYGLMWPNTLAGLAWMPWVVLAAERAWKEGRGAVFPAAVVAAMQLLSGAPEVSLLTWLFLGVLWGAQLTRAGSERGRMTARALAFGGLTAGLAAVQLLPFLDLLAHSQRSTGYGSSAVGGIAAMPLTGWANYLVPLFQCARHPQGVYHQVHQPWLGSYYVGVGIVALALLAAWRARDRHTWVLIGVTLFSLFMALGSAGWVYDWFQWLVPLFGFMRYPIKFVMLATFTLPLLAAVGLGWLQRVPPERWPREGRRLKGLALGLLGLIAVIVGFAWRYPLEPAQVAATAGNAFVRALFLVAVLGCCALLRRDAGSKLQRLLQVGLVLLLWFDVFTHAPNLSPTVPASVLKPGTIRQFFGWNHPLQVGVSRALQSKESFWRMLAPGTKDAEQELYGRRLSLSLNFNLLDHAAKFDGFYSLDLKEFLEVFQQVYFTTNEATKLKDFLGISHVSNPTNVVDWVSRDSFLPLITAGQQPAYAASADTLTALMSDGFEPRRTVFLPPAAQGEIRATRQSNATVTQSQFAPHLLDMAVETGAPTMVVVAQTYYHPWQAYVDGRPTPLYRANYAFQALEVPSGRHRVSLVYEDRLFLWGASLSAVSMLWCGGFWGWGRRGSLRSRPAGAGLDGQEAECKVPASWPPEVASGFAKRPGIGYS
jgi:hypothetical protein